MKKLMMSAIFLVMILAIPHTTTAGGASTVVFDMNSVLNQIANGAITIPLFEQTHTGKSSIQISNGASIETAPSGEQLVSYALVVNASTGFYDARLTVTDLKSNETRLLALVPTALRPGTRCL